VREFFLGSAVWIQPALGRCKEDRVECSAAAPRCPVIGGSPGTGAKPSTTGKSLAQQKHRFDDRQDKILTSTANSTLTIPKSNCRIIG
jgi:hypothetical protein